MAQLILPLSLFLGLLMTLGKLYTESEITVMHACGLSKAVLVKAAMILAVFTAIVAAVNVMWAGPWSSRHQDEVLAEAKANPGMAALAQGQFQQATNGSSVLFIESVDGSDFKDVFLAQIRPKVMLVLLWWWPIPTFNPAARRLPGRHSTRERASKALHCYVISALRTSRIIRRSLVTRRWRSTRTIPTRWTCVHCGTLIPIVLAQN